MGSFHSDFWSGILIPYHALMVASCMVKRWDWHLTKLYGKYVLQLLLFHIYHPKKRSTQHVQYSSCNMLWPGILLELMTLYCLQWNMIPLFTYASESLVTLAWNVNSPLYSKEWIYWSKIGRCFSCWSIEVRVKARSYGNFLVNRAWWTVHIGGLFIIKKQFVLHVNCGRLIHYIMQSQ